MWRPNKKMKFFDFENRKCSDAVRGSLDKIFWRRKRMFKNIWTRVCWAAFKRVRISLLILIIFSILLFAFGGFFIWRWRPGFDSLRPIKPRVLPWSNRPYKKPGQPRSGPCAQSWPRVLCKLPKKKKKSLFIRNRNQGLNVFTDICTLISNNFIPT